MPNLVTLGVWGESLFNPFLLNVLLFSVITSICKAKLLLKKVQIHFFRYFDNIPTYSRGNTDMLTIVKASFHLSLVIYAINKYFTSDKQDGKTDMGHTKSTSSVKWVFTPPPPMPHFMTFLLQTTFCMSLIKKMINREQKNTKLFIYATA